MSVVSLALAPGAVIDNLRVDRVLGQGAFGITYLVTDLVLNKSFALKEYLPRDQVSRGEDGRLQPISEQAWDRYSTGLSHFLAEGRTVAQLEHANIVKVFRCFEANGTAYLLMPWYRGEALHTLLKRSGTFTLEEALALSRPLLDTLEYIHGKGLVHQDIKPANIYITEDGQPILLDFGAAGQRLDADTSTRWKLGSEGYAALEQSAAAASIGPWTDIYGLAATLYRCICGQIPVAAVQRQKALSEGEADPLQAIENLVPAQQFSGILDAIGQGMELEPAFRPRSVADWRPAFGQGKGAITESLHAGIEQEGREWLPIILLSAFSIVLAGAVIYLFTGGGPEPGESAGDQAADSSGSAEPSSQLRTASPEETARWLAALEVDTPYAYQLFMQDFQDSIHKEQAQSHLERLDNQAWGYADQKGTKAAIEAYMDMFLSGLHEADARIRLDALRLEFDASQRELIEKERQDRKAWERARTERSIASIDQYLAEWPGGLYGDEARKLRRQI